MVHTSKRSFGLPLRGLAVAAALLGPLLLGHSAARAESKGLLVVFMPPGTDNYLAQWQDGAQDQGEGARLRHQDHRIEPRPGRAGLAGPAGARLGRGGRRLHLVALRQRGRHRLAARAVADRQAGDLHQPVSDRGNREVLDRLCRRRRLPQRQDRRQDAARRLREEHDREVRQGHDHHLPGRLLRRVATARRRSARRSPGSSRSSRRSRPASCRRRDTSRLADHPAQEGRDHLGLYGERQLADGRHPGARRRAGKNPGKDVLVVGGTCHGDTTDLLTGKLVGTGVQAAFLEGWQSVQTPAQVPQHRQGEGRQALPRQPTPTQAARMTARRRASTSSRTRPSATPRRTSTTSSSGAGPSRNSATTDLPRRRGRSPRRRWRRPTLLPDGSGVPWTTEAPVLRDAGHHQALRIGDRAEGRGLQPCGAARSWRCSGENGAGKSTLVKILAGLERPDAGTIEIDGELRRLRSPSQSLHAGVAYVTQELSIISAAVGRREHLPGRRPQRRSGPRGRLAQTRPAATSISSGSGTSIPPCRPGIFLSAQRQLVEIARLLSRNARILILDEPTAALSDVEIEKVMTVVRSLAARRPIDHLRHAPPRRGVRDRRPRHDLPQRRQLRADRGQEPERRRADRASARAPARPDVPGTRLRARGPVVLALRRRHRAGPVPSGLVRTAQGRDPRPCRAARQRRECRRARRGRGRAAPTVASIALRGQIARSAQHARGDGAPASPIARTTASATASSPCATWSRT